MKRKIVVIAMLTIMIALLSSDYVFATPGISAAENMILDKLKDGVVMDGERRTIPVSYLNQIENEFIKNSQDITQEQAEVIIDKIEEVLNIVKTMNIKELTDLNNTETVLRIITLIDEAASAAGYRISINPAEMSINIINPQNNVISIAKDGINQTGLSVYWMIVFRNLVLTIVFVSLPITLGLVLIVRQRKKKHLKETITKEITGNNYEA